MFQFRLDSTQNVTNNVTSTLTLTSSASAFVVHSANVTSTLSLVQSLASTRGLQQTITQALNLTQSGQEQSIFSRLISSILTLSQTVSLHKVLNFHLTQTLSLTQKVTPSIPLDQHLTLTQSVKPGAVLHLTISQILSFNQSLFQNIHYVSVSSHLTFNDPYPLRTLLNNTVIFIPAAQGILVPRKYCVRLHGPFESKGKLQTVLLPCPLWNDSESNDNQLSIKRTMTGLTYSYVKQFNYKKFKYTFQVDRPKAYELRTFLRNHLSDIITVDNWKGERWVSYIVNNPVDLIPKSPGNCGDRVDISLEFLGTKIN